jgi:hypothetical protein
MHLYYSCKLLFISLRVKSRQVNSRKEGRENFPFREYLNLTHSPPYHLPTLHPYFAFALYYFMCRGHKSKFIPSTFSFFSQGCIVHDTRSTTFTSIMRKLRDICFQSPVFPQKFIIVYPISPGL